MGRKTVTHAEEEPCEFTTTRVAVAVAVGWRERERGLGIEETYALVGDIARSHQCQYALLVAFHLCRRRRRLRRARTRLGIGSGEGGGEGGARRAREIREGQ